MGNAAWRDYQRFLSMIVRFPERLLTPED